MAQTKPTQNANPKPEAGKDPPRETPIQAVRNLIHKWTPHMAGVLPQGAGLTADRLARVFVNCIEGDETGKLLRCTNGSLVRALIHAAEVGLEPGGALGHAYLIPYKNRTLSQDAGRDIFEAEYQVGIWGLIALVRRSGEVADVWARCVFEGEAFEELGGSQPALIHKPDPFAAEGRKRIGAYACARLKDGTVNWSCVSEADIQRARAQNTGKSPAWDLWPDEMAKKVALKRAQKTWPKRIEDAEAINRAIQIDEEPQQLPPHLQRLAGLLEEGSRLSVLDREVATRKAAVAPGERVVEHDPEYRSKPAQEPPADPDQDGR